MPRNTYIGLGKFSPSTCAYPAASGTGLSGSADSQFLSGPLGNGVVFLVDALAMTTTQLPDTRTYTYNLVFSNNQDLTSIITTVFMGKQTGVSGAGAVAQTFAARLPSGTTAKYYGLQIVASASTVATGTTAAQMYVAAVDPTI